MHPLLAVPLALYLGCWAHEITHTTQGLADGVAVAPFVFPFTALNDCWLGDATDQHTEVPGIGCTDTFPAFEAHPRAVEAVAYLVQALATVAYAVVLVKTKVA